MKQYKDRIIINNFLRFLLCAAVIGIISFKSGVVAVAATNTVGDMAVYPGVTISPDGTAWTTDYMDKTNESLPEGYTISTGQTSSLQNLKVGEHYYQAAAEGSINIGKWVVAWQDAQCIHYFEAHNYKGFQTKEGICEEYYNNGWNAYCADCNELIANLYFYAKSDTIKGILTMPAESCYLYLCPHCEGLEQGVTYQHICKEISYNYYNVSYIKNAPVDTEVSGYMAVTRHMYNNAATYEGVEANKLGYGDTKLRANNYVCKGYVFMGWNTKPDGSGDAFTDGQSVINLSSDEGATVKLYAQWKRVDSTLVIDANGGTYHGEATYQITQECQTTYQIDDNKLFPAPGYTVKFETNGGSVAADVVTNKQFSHWELQEGWKGSFIENVYKFPEIEGNVDMLEAQYTNVAFSLPDSKKENEALVGWYKDAACTEGQFVGAPGDYVSVSTDTVLYAKWARLTLWAQDDYVSHEGVGAVDLTWEQKDGQSKYYKLYQSLDKEDWKMIYKGNNKYELLKISQQFGTDMQGKQYTVEYTGYYKLTAVGAKGGDYDAVYLGGNGGSVTAEYWLEKGDILTFYSGTSGYGMAGGSNGSKAYGGNALSEAGRGGGAGTEIYLTREEVVIPLLIAGGGGGAGEKISGEQGGSSLSVIGNMSGTSSTYGGGGGGAAGGAGGVYVVHYHEGDPNAGGGCYIKNESTVVCGTSKVEHDYYECVCGDTWGTGSHSYYKSKHKSCGGYYRNTSYQCSGCGKSLSSGETHYTIGVTIELGCAYWDKPDGYVVSASPAGGGTSYVNTGFGCKNQMSSAGVNNAAGGAQIQSTDIGYQEKKELQDALARDMAAPGRVETYTVSIADEEKVIVMLTPPADNGTTYYHMAESYRFYNNGTEQIATSNITANTLTTGIAGYFYYVDAESDGTVTNTHARTASEKISVEMTEKKLYLHVAAVDVAGNLGETTHIELIFESGVDAQYPTDASYPEDAKLFTEQLAPENTEFVYQPDEKNCFVKADGVTEHTMNVYAGLDKAATLEFQIDGLRLNVCNETHKEWMQTTIPHGNIALNAESFSNDKLSMNMSVEDVLFLHPETAVAERINHATQIDLSQKFTVNAGVPIFHMYPQAIAEFMGQQYHSEEEQDVLNGLTIIPDGEAPEIFGLEELQNLDVLDMTEQSKQVVLWAEDDLSGLQEFTISICNKDNYMEAEFVCDSEGKVEIEISKDNPLYIGEIEISAIAVDRVCNAKVIGENGLTFTLETGLYKERNPEENILKTGDGAVLDIMTSGYVERIEVIFPEVLLTVNPELNCVFEYEKPSLRKKEALKFNIPLGTPEQEYEVIVKAYKNGQMLISKPTLIVVEGNVLDELRTRIRNNG